MKHLFWVLLVILLLAGCFRIPQYVYDVEASATNITWKTPLPITNWKVCISNYISNNWQTFDTTDTKIEWNLPPGVYTIKILGYWNEPDGFWNYRDYYRTVLYLK